MKKLLLGAAVAFLTISIGDAMAQCASGTALNQNAIRSLVGGNTVCGRPGASYPGGAGSSDRWQEEHQGANSGPLVDYKLGDGHPIDPRKQVGTWDTVGAATARIEHAYTGGPTYQWTVHNNTTYYSFCTAAGGAEHVRAKIKAGTNVGCAAGDFPP